jgi:hypothetical protein
MRRNIILACLLVAVGSALPAESFIFVGAGMGYVSQDTAANRPWSAVPLGLIEQSYNDLTANLGIYSAASIGFLVSSRTDGTGLDLGQYNTFSLNVLLGLGWQIALDKLIATAAAGIYFGADTLSSLSATLSSYTAGGAGGGVGLPLLYSISYNWGLGATVNAAYYFSIPGNTAPTMAPSGFTVFGGVGVSYFFQPSPNLGGISRY